MFHVGYAAFLKAAKAFGGDGNEVGHAVVPDGLGGLFAVGAFEGTAAFGGLELVAAGGRDAFVLRLDSNGNVLWATSFGGAGGAPAPIVIETKYQ